MRRKCMRRGPGGTESADAPLVVEAPLEADAPLVADAALVSITTLYNIPVQHMLSTYTTITYLPSN